MNWAFARLRPRAFLALCGVAVGGAMLAHGLLHALIGGGHEVGGRWHEPLLSLAIAGIGWALADRRRSGLADMGCRAAGPLTWPQFSVFIAVEAGEGHLGELAWWKLLLAFAVQAFVAVLMARSLPAVARVLDAHGAFRLASPAGGHVRCEAAPSFARAASYAACHAPRAPPAQP